MASVPLSRRAYAKARGVSEGAIRKAIAAGKIDVREDGLIDPDDADRAWWNSSRQRPFAVSGGLAAANGAGEDPELDIAEEVLACLYTGQDDHTRQLAMLTEIRDAQRRISEQLAEVNLRLRIQRDPFHAFTIEGARLVRQDEARKPPPSPVGARKLRRV